MQAAESRKNEEAAKRIDPQVPKAPLERAPAQTEEERIRRFMEALGVPTTSPAPPKVERRQVVPKRPREPKPKILPVDPFPRPRFGPSAPPIVITPQPVIASAPSPTPSPPPLPVVLLAPPQTEQQSAQYDVYDIKVPTEEGASATPTLVRQKVVVVEQTWAARLATAEGLRSAIIMREIFGPPRSMQSVEQDLLTKI
jgi:hypothetical protein